ncbi:MAG: FGGY family carbohydrate kinase, partial [Infirmifilum sp.]
MSHDLFLALDIGTTNVKGAVFQLGRGIPLDSIARRVSLYTNEENMVAEQDPKEINLAVEEVISYFTKKYGSDKISTIFLSSQMHAFGVMDGEGRPKTRLLTYFDTRSREVLPEIEVRSYELYTRTGCPPLHIYPLAKILLAKRRGWVTSSDKLLLSAKDYVIFKMTGQHALDLSTASGSQLLNVHQLKWDDLALEISGVDDAQLPEALEGSKTLLPLSGEFANKVGLSPEVEVYTGVSDATANQLGVGSVTHETIAINIGTSAAVRFLLPQPLIDDSRMRFFVYYAGNKKETQLLHF